MRFAIVVLAAAGLLIGATAAPVTALAATSDHAIALDQQPQPQPQPPASGGTLDVDIDTNEGGAWYTSPLWITVGVIALVLLVLVIVMATRGGGTTIIRE